MTGKCWRYFAAHIKAIKSKREVNMSLRWGVNIEKSYDVKERTKDRIEEYVLKKLRYNNMECKQASDKPGWNSTLLLSPANNVK
jgi:hypothetical protein